MIFILYYLLVFFIMISVLLYMENRVLKKQEEKHSAFLMQHLKELQKINQDFKKLSKDNEVNLNKLDYAFSILKEIISNPNNAKHIATTAYFSIAIPGDSTKNN